MSEEEFNRLVQEMILECEAGHGFNNIGTGRESI